MASAASFPSSSSIPSTLPSQPTPTVDKLLQKVLDLLEFTQVRQDEKTFNLLEKKTELLLVLDQQEPLSEQDQAFYLWTKQLIDEAGKVRSFVNQKLSELLIDKTEFKEAQVEVTASKPPTVAESSKAPAVPSMAFGKARWEQYMGDIGIEPPLPANIQEILNSPCPFWEGKRIQDTHLLTLIPEKVDGKPLTLESLGWLVAAPKQGHATQYSAKYFKEHGDRPASSSHWVLMTRDVLPESRKKNYADQQKLVQTYSAKSHMVYQLPNILDAATAIFMEYISSGTRLYNDAPATVTRCVEKNDIPWTLIRDLEKVGEIQSILVVGCFDPDGLQVRGYTTYDSYEDIGVAGLRKF